MAEGTAGTAFDLRDRGAPGPELSEVESELLDVMREINDDGSIETGGGRPHLYMTMAAGVGATGSAALGGLWVPNELVDAAVSALTAKSYEIT